MESWLNCAFTGIALPLGLVLLAYGIYLLATGQGDHGVFLIVLAVLLLLAVASGHFGSSHKKVRLRPLPPNNGGKKK